MGATWHGDIPWRELLRWYRWGRRLGFSKARPEGDTYLRTPASIDDLRAVLGQMGYAPAWKFSYDKGEDLNLAYVYYEGDQWRQCHVRIWGDGDYRYLSAHDELTPEQHPKAHLQGDTFDRDVGMAQLQADLGALYIEFETVAW